jgi:hypothetical protein
MELSGRFQDPAALPPLFLVSGPVGTHDQILIRSKTSTCFEIGPRLRREEGNLHSTLLSLIFHVTSERGFLLFDDAVSV